MLQLSFAPFPILNTQRLVLRKPMVGDVPETFYMRTNEQVNKYVDRPRPGSFKEAAMFIEKLIHSIDNNECIAWALTLKNDPKLIGSICLWNISKENQTAEIGFELAPAFQGQGLMQEAITEILNYGWNNIQLQKIEGWAHKENLPSIKLMENNRFFHDIDTQNKHIGKEYFNDMVIYSLLSPKM